MTRHTLHHHDRSFALAIGLCAAAALLAFGAACSDDTPDPSSDVQKSALAARDAVNALRTVDVYTDFSHFIAGDAGVARFSREIFDGVGLGADLLRGNRPGFRFDRAAQALSAEPGRVQQALRAAAEPRTDPPDLDCDLRTGVCVVTVTTHYDGPEDELVTLVQVVTLDTRGNMDPSDDIVLAYEARKSYRDGSEGAVEAEPLDDDGNLKIGAARVRETRTWPEGETGADGETTTVVTLELALNTPDNDADDVLFFLDKRATFADGRQMQETASDPQLEGEEGYRNLTIGPTAYRRTDVFPEGFVHPEGLVSVETTVDLLVNDLNDPADDVWIHIAATKQYGDGSHGTSDVTDVDGDGVLPGGRVRYREERTWDDEDVSAEDLRSGVMTLVLDIGSTATDADDMLVSLELVAGHRDGTRSVVHILPDAPVPAGQEPRTGTIMWETTFPEGADFVSARRTLTGTDGAGGAALVTVTDEVTYRNGQSGTDTRTVEIFADGRGRVRGAGRDGTTYEGEFDQTDGSFSVTYRPAPGSDVASVTEAGRYVEQGMSATGELTRTVTLADGTVLRTRARIERHGATTRLVVEESPGDGTGTIVVHEGRFFTRILVDWTDARGNVARYHARQWLGGHAALDLWLDDASTPQSPDLTGSLRFRPDGSGYGVLHVTAADGTTATVRVSFDQHGRGRAIGGEDGAEEEALF